ncbi:MAG: carbonic anhydrase [Labilithrix sp.]|nr:carbonic anhydrase [Labilithrix sp.]MCW5811363.1 carbonic anhydrase [Labilithrix sp.]
MKSLNDGIRRYETLQRPRYSARFAELASGQDPLAMFIGCADSRVVPHLVASAGPGDLFVVRNVANLVHPHCDDGHGADVSVASAVWYATEVLGVREIVVCGHSGCGGMQAVMGDVAPEHLQRWLTPAAASLAIWTERGPYDPSYAPVDQLSQINARRQLDNLRTYEHVARRERRGELTLHAWWFDIPNAKLLAFDDTHDRFIPALNVGASPRHPTPDTALALRARGASRPLARPLLGPRGSRSVGVQRAKAST